jgi:hypothetical protein
VSSELGQTVPNKCSMVWTDKRGCFLIMSKMAPALHGSISHCSITAESVLDLVGIARRLIARAAGPVVSKLERCQE